MRNITFSADDQMIQQAREQAEADNSTLNEQFRLWLESYARRRQAGKALETMRRIGSYASSGGRKFTRDEMNERR